MLEWHSVTANCTFTIDLEAQMRHANYNSFWRSNLKHNTKGYHSIINQISQIQSEECSRDMEADHHLIIGSILLLYCNVSLPAFYVVQVTL